jgi:hypothetical protein
MSIATVEWTMNLRKGNREASQFPPYSSRDVLCLVMSRDYAQMLGEWVFSIGRTIDKYNELL